MRIAYVAVLTFVLGYVVPCGLAQSPTDEGVQDAIQRGADYLLQGLPAVEVTRLADDRLKGLTKGRVTHEHLSLQLEAVLNRFHVPLAPSSAPSNSYTWTKDKRGNVGAIFIRVEATSYADGMATATVTLDVSEFATLKRDPSRGLGATVWSDKLEVDSAAEPQKGFRDAIAELGRRFALAYLAANSAGRAND